MNIKRFLGFWLSFWLGLGIVLAIAQSLPAQNAKITQATITEILQGNQVFVLDQQAKLKDVAKIGEQVRTGNARAELTFNNQAIARLATNSRLTVGNCGAQLQQGQALFTGTISACTATVTAAVRGTTYTIDVTSKGSEEINVLEGEVEVSKIAPLPDEEYQWQVKAGENCLINPQKRGVIIRALQEREFRELLKGRLFKGFRQNDQSLAKIERIYSRLYPGKRFPLRRGALSSNRGHFSLAIRQKQPLLSQVIARVSLQTRRGEGFMPERLIGNFVYPINQKARFVRGLNPEDRVTVRLFNRQNQFLGYSTFELQDENAAVTIILPDQTQSYGAVRTVIGTDANLQGKIDSGTEVFDYFSFVSPSSSSSASLENEKVIFLSDSQVRSQNLNLDFFAVSNLPTPALPVTFPDSFNEGNYAIATRPISPFATNLPTNLTELPNDKASLMEIKKDGTSTFDVPQEILKSKQRPNQPRLLRQRSRLIN